MDVGFYVQARHGSRSPWVTLQQQTPLIPEQAGEMCRALREKAAAYENYSPEYRVVQLVEIS